MDRKAKYVYFFGGGQAEGSGQMKDLLGGKGAGLAEMTNLGLPVPPGFTITTEACRIFYENGEQVPDFIWQEVEAHLRRLEEVSDKRFGDPSNPLLVSVRSGAKFSMPGMMDTILNLGMNDAVAEGLARLTGDRRFAMDTYRRFLQMFGSIALGIPKERFHEALEDLKRRRGVRQDVELTADDLAELVETFKAIIQQATGAPFPQDPRAQLRAAITAVFRSWNNPRAQYYRKIHGIPDDLGTACSVVMMVYGNIGEDSGTGVGFTRNPATGEKVLYGEFLPNAQGEDVVAGIRTPLPLQELERRLPDVYARLRDIAEKLERHYRDVQDFEFTVERGRLYMLQTRVGKRTAQAAVRIAVDMVREGLIRPEEAVLRVDPAQVEQLLHPVIDPAVRAQHRPVAQGLPASPGAASGRVVFTADEAVARAENGEVVLLVRDETTPDDIHGMHRAVGILTSRGGMTCVAGETLILTDRGLMTAEEAYHRFERGEVLRILSFDSRSLKSVWRRVIAAGKRPAEVITVTVSQTGRAESNTLRLTPDHKMLTLERRCLVKKPLADVLRDEDFVLVVDRVPGVEEAPTSPKFAYLVGAILSDGCIQLGSTKGAVIFTQKPVPEKAAFIEAVEQAFRDTFGIPFTYVRHRDTVAVLRGRTIRGSVEDRIGFRREPAARLAAIKDDLVAWVLRLDRAALAHFLAGYIDGDGTFAGKSSEVRVQISISRTKPRILAGLVIACLRLGIVPQVTPNRESFWLQITEGLDEILTCTRRVRPDLRSRLYESKCFAVRGLFDDIVDRVNFMGRVRQGLRRNIMFGVEKIRRDILPLCPEEVHRQVQDLLESDLRSFRVRQTGGPEPATVYNFEVEAQDEIDKCFVVFSSRLTPVLVSNSHAAVVARGMGKPCVVGCEALQIDPHRRELRIGSTVLREGDWLTIDGSTGEVFVGQLPTVEPRISDEFATLLEWADQFRKLGVRANADTPRDAEIAYRFGAQGIGLCRTEHMFFGEDRLPHMVRMIMAATSEERRAALNELLRFQVEDFVGIFRAMQGYPVTIRLLDPPLHEFLPKREELIQEIAELKFRLTRTDDLKAMDALLKALHEKERLLARVNQLYEFNPMLGHRGVRLVITYPEIVEMQTRAIIEAAIRVKRQGMRVAPEIMVPLVSTDTELEQVRRIIEMTAERVMEEQGIRVLYQIGTMIEVPRACLVADRIAAYAEFFSFGTNDLTQMTFGFSRDDINKFLPDYLEKKILPADPFQTLDTEGVGELVRIAIRKGRSARGNLKIGICGEHGGDPASIAFCHEVGMNYVSCSPYRVPVARLAAAQAALRTQAVAAEYAAPV